MHLIWVAPGGTPTGWGHIAAAHTAPLLAHRQCPRWLTDILACCGSCQTSNKKVKKIKHYNNIFSKLYGLYDHSPVWVCVWRAWAGTRTVWPPHRYRWVRGFPETRPLRLLHPQTKRKHRPWIRCTTLYYCSDAKNKSIKITGVQLSHPDSNSFPVNEQALLPKLLCLCGFVITLETNILLKSQFH